MPDPSSGAGTTVSLYIMNAFDPGGDLLHPVRQKIGTRLLLGILFVSSMATTVFTAVAFYLDYRTELNEIETRLGNITQGSVPPLAKAVFEVNEELVSTIARSILNIRDVVRVQVDLEEGLQSFTLQKPGSATRDLFAMLYGGDDVVRVWTLPDPGFAGSSAGTLTVTVSQKNMFRRLWSKALYFFLSQGAKTFLVSFLILLLVRMVVTRHLESLLRYWGRQDIGSPSRPAPLRLAKNKSGDELDRLCSYTNEVFARLSAHNRRRQEETDEHREKARHAAQLAGVGLLAGGVAHEINNPLAIIAGNMELLELRLKEAGQEDPTVNKLLNSTAKSLKRISSITYGLLAYSRDGETDPMAPTDLITVLGDIVDLAEIRRHKTEVEIDLIRDLPDGPVSVLCREVQIGQVFINLINNAFDAVEARPGEENWVRISCATRSGIVRIVVENSGPPISPGVVSRIFDPFFTTKEVGKGTGLGLSICLGHIREHGGEIHVDYDADHPVFVVTLPLADAARQAS